MSSSRPQILMLVHRVPYPPNRGDRIRSYHLLRFLAQRADVWLATLADEPVAAGTNAALAGLCRQVAIEPVGGSRWLRGALSLAMGRSATEGLFACGALRRTIGRWRRQVRWDAVLVFCSSMLPYADLPALCGIPLVVDLVDVDSQKFLDYAALARAPRRWLYRLEGQRLRRLECTLPGRAQAILLVSEAEADLYRRICPNDRTLALPNGVDLDYFQPASQAASTWEPLPEHVRPSLVFVGALDYHANVDGVRWFVHEVWPHLRKALPKLTLALVGRKPVPAVQKLAQAGGIRVFADVPDVRPYLAAADLAIAPLRIARGVQNKVLEALAMGKPVVASPQAAEGLTAAESGALCVASSAQEWIDQITRWMADPAGRAALGRAGRDYVAAHHAWSQTLAPLASLLQLPADPTAHPAAHPSPLTAPGASAATSLATSF
jgi:sugar transferase (PEP-CTERM/EpsH1 system associated)